MPSKFLPHHNKIGDERPNTTIAHAKAQTIYICIQNASLTFHIVIFHASFCVIMKVSRCLYRPNIKVYFDMSTAHFQPINSYYSYFHPKDGVGIWWESPTFAPVSANPFPDLLRHFSQTKKSQCLTFMYGCTGFFGYNDIVNIGLHFILKNVRPYAASCSEA